jgi:hypothetical protein
MDNSTGRGGQDDSGIVQPDVIRQVEALIARGGVAALNTLAEALEAEARDLSARLVRAEAALRYVAFALAASPGEEYAHALFSLLPNRPFFHQHLRDLVGVLVGSQPPAIVRALFERYAESHEYAQAVGQYHHAELMALLLHEAVLRGVILDGMPVIERLTERLRSRRHPLAWLSLRLLPQEEALRRRLAAYNRRAREWQIPRDEEDGTLHFVPDTPVASIPRDVTRATASEAIKTAVAEWFNHDARVYTLEPPAADVSPALLLALGLELLEGAERRDVTLRKIAYGDALGELFTIAAYGGPYESGHGGAYGRLEAWRSLAALAGAPADATMDAVAALAGECRWFAFDAESGWFYRAGWDVGIVALRPGGGLKAAPTVLRCYRLTRIMERGERRGRGVRRGDASRHPDVLSFADP